MNNSAPVPASLLPDPSFADDIVVESRRTLAVMPTGEWRRSLRTRLSQLEGAVDALKARQADEDERRRVTTQALHFFCAVKGPIPSR